MTRIFCLTMVLAVTGFGRSAAVSTDGGVDGGADAGHPPLSGEMGATCTTNAECNAVAGGGTCPQQGFPSEFLGCTKRCTKDDDCGLGSWCVDFADAGYPYLEQSCVRGCSSDNDCNPNPKYGQHCVCSLIGPGKQWCSPWPADC